MKDPKRVKLLIGDQEIEGYDSSEIEIEHQLPKEIKLHVMHRVNRLIEEGKDIQEIAEACFKDGMNVELHIEAQPALRDAIVTNILSKCPCANCFVAASGCAPPDEIIRCHHSRDGRVVFPFNRFGEQL